MCLSPDWLFVLGRAGGGGTRLATVPGSCQCVRAWSSIFVSLLKFGHWQEEWHDIIQLQAPKGTQGCNQGSVEVGASFQVGVKYLQSTTTIRIILEHGERACTTRALRSKGDWVSLLSIMICAIGAYLAILASEREP